MVLMGNSARLFSVQHCPSAGDHRYGKFPLSASASVFWEGRGKNLPLLCSFSWTRCGSTGESESQGLLCWTQHYRWRQAVGSLFFFFSSYLLSFHSFLLPVLALGEKCPAGLVIFSLSLSCCFSSLWHKMSVLLKERCCPPPITLCGCCWGSRVTPSWRGPPRGFGAWGR